MRDRKQGSSNITLVAECVERFTQRKGTTATAMTASASPRRNTPSDSSTAAGPPPATGPAAARNKAQVSWA